ncbi:hypothetical protein D3C83_15600 [compost metagenome]
MPAAKPDQPPHEERQFFVDARQIPMHPAHFVVLAVRIVVAALGAPELVSREQHRHTLRQEQRRQHVVLLALAQRENGGVGGGTLRAAIPAEVVILAVAVVGEIGLVVLFVIAHEIVERKTVMRGDEVDARAGAASAVAVEIARSGQP